MAFLKQTAFATLLVIGMVAASGYCLYFSLKYGIAFGKRSEQSFTKREKPFLYWFFVVVYAFAFACSIFSLITVIRGDIVAAHWPTVPKLPN
jgi:hypothetical protein